MMNDLDAIHAAIRELERAGSIIGGKGDWHLGESWLRTAQNAESAYRRLVKERRGASND